MPEEPLQAFVKAHRPFTLETVKRFPELYAASVEFRDPFKHFKSDLPGMQRYFQRMFKTFQEVNFTIEDAAGGEDGAYVRWRLSVARKAGGKAIESFGISHLRFDGQGKVVWQEDAMDPSGIYQMVPVLSAMLRLVRRFF